MLSLLANIGSIAGFVATLVTWWSAQRSKQYYLLVGRVPEQIEELQDRIIELANAIDPDVNRQDRLRALKAVRIAVESIARNIGRRHRDEFLALKDTIRKIEKEKPLDEGALYDIWTEAHALAIKARNVVEDSKFTRGSILDDLWTKAASLR